MNRYPTWKYILIAASIIIGLVYTIPNLFGESPAVQISPARATLKADQALLGKVEAALELAGIPLMAFISMLLALKYDSTTLRNN